MIVPESLKTNIGMVPKIDHDDFLSHIFNLGTNFLRTVTELFYFIACLFNSAVFSLDYIALIYDGMDSG